MLAHSYCNPVLQEPENEGSTIPQGTTMNTAHFYVTGNASGTVLTSDISCNGCVLWAEQYTKYGDFGGHEALQVWEWDADSPRDTLVTTLYPANDEEPRRWEDATDADQPVAPHSIPVFEQEQDVQGEFIVGWCAL